MCEKTLKRMEERLHAEKQAHIAETDDIYCVYDISNTTCIERL